MRLRLKFEYQPRDPALLFKRAGKTRPRLPTTPSSKKLHQQKATALPENNEPADWTVCRLFQDIRLAREIEKRAWVKLATHLSRQKCQRV
jgi:hypothetical protein